MYSSKEAMEKGIASVKKNAPNAPIPLVFTSGK
ncbi:YegP family protein [Tenacibaculum sp. FZY0031]